MSIFLILPEAAAWWNNTYKVVEKIPTLGWENKLIWKIQKCHSMFLWNINEHLDLPLVGHGDILSVCFWLHLPKLKFKIYFSIMKRGIWRSWVFEATFPKTWKSRYKMEQSVRLGRNITQPTGLKNTVCREMHFFNYSLRRHFGLFLSLYKVLRSGTHMLLISTAFFVYENSFKLLSLSKLV